MNPLNPSLYTALRNRFGDVTIANEGQHIVIRQRRDWKSLNVEDDIIDPGEYYRVDCPYCGDRKGRLWVNHCWNTKRNGRTFGKHLIVCYNEECDMRNFEFELMQWMGTSGLIEMPRCATPDEYLKSLEIREVTLPGVCLPLGGLPDDHPAKNYLRSRNFDPAELAEVWGLQYCVSAEVDNNGHIPGTTIFGRLVTNRIIIPVWWESKLVGWQARAINDYNEPKYYTMPDFKKRLVLFNGDRAQQYPMVVITEGFMKCARVGAMSVALLGKSLSNHQAGLIADIWGEKPICIMTDPGAESDAQGMMDQLNPDHMRKNIFIATPPIDPDKMPRDQLWGVIRAAAAQAKDPVILPF